MRTSWCVAAFLLLAAGAVTGAQARVDPEKILSERFQFSAAEVADARQGKPAVKVKASSDELYVLGAIRIPGKKERLADWLRNIEHFRNAAELGMSHVVPAPPTAAAFAQVPVDAADLSDLAQCAAGKCPILLSAEAQAQLQRDPSKAADIIRQMLLGYTTAYLSGGDAAVAAYDGSQSRRSFVEDMRRLAGESTTLTALSSDLVAYLERYPAGTLPNSQQLFYWASAPVESNSVLTLHHLVVYRPAPAEVWVVDKQIYASRYVDAGALAIGLYDAPDGTGFYAVVGSRAKMSALGGVAATVLRRQIQRSAADTVKMYLEWLRESLAQ
jgi:hypothetical protein